MSVITKLDKAKAQIVIDHPFFAAILLKRDLIKTEAVPTMGVDRRNNIYYNEKFVESLTVPQIVFGLCHEVMHVVGQHSNRVGHRNKRRWNIATDAWINDTLKDAAVGQFIEGAVDMPGSKDLWSEEIYNRFGDNDSALPGNGFGDEFVEGGPAPSADEIKNIIAENKVTIAEAAQAAKVRGRLPANIQRIVEEIIFVKTPWFEILERWMTSTRCTDSTWRHPNRRFKAQGMYLPMRKSEGAMAEMVIGVDTSGSIDKEMLDYFAGHVNRIIELCSPERVHVVYCDAHINHVDVFEQGEWPVELKPCGGGGTVLTRIFEWIAEHGIDPSCVVILTDGYTDFPDEVAFPTVWAITTEVTAPIEAGETVHVSMSDDKE